MLPQHSDVQTSKHPDLSPSVRFSPPPLLELEYHLFSSVVSFSISFYDLVASPLYLLLLLLLFTVSLSPLPLHRRYQSAYVANCQCWPVQVTMTSLPLFLSPYLSLSIPLSLYFRVYLAFWSDPLDSDVYTKTHGWGRERDREREEGGRERRETCRSILCAATTRSHPSPRRAATMNP